MEALDALARKGRPALRRLPVYGRSMMPSGPHEPGPELHPYCSQTFCSAFEVDPESRLCVPPWRTWIVLRGEGLQGGARRGSGLYPFASLDPACDLPEGLEYLRERGIESFYMVTDPLWCPPVEALREAFDFCRPLKLAWLIDREQGPVRFRKKHRNRINRSRRRCETRVVSLLDHADACFELYRSFAAQKEITGAMDVPESCFPTLAGMKQITTIGTFAEEELLAFSIWARFREAVYFLLGASSTRGYEIAAAYAYHAFAIEYFEDCRYVLFGPETGMVDTPEYPSAGFKSGFANATAQVWVCGSKLGFPSGRGHP
jgi:hypothetical protein